MSEISPSASFCSTSSTSATASASAFGESVPSPTPSWSIPKTTFLPSGERAVLDRPDGQEHGAVDALERARQDVRAEEGLVAVDADPPDALVLRRRERAEAASSGDLEDDLRARCDLVQRELLALGLVLPVLRVRPRHLRPRHCRLCTGLVAGDEAVDRRLLEATHGADRLAAGLLGLERAEVPDEVAHLLLAEEEALDVRRLALQERLVDVDDREVRVGEPLGGRRDRVALREADPDDEVVALAGERGHVRHVVGSGLRLDHTAGDPHLALRALQPLEGELVEAVVVQLPRVGDEPDLERRRRRGRLGRRAARLVVAAAARRERRGTEDDGREREESGMVSSHRSHSCC